MRSFKTFSIFGLGIIIGISLILFVSIISKNGFLKLTQADNQSNPPPFICINCSLGNGSDGTGPGDRFKGKDLTNAYITGFSSTSNDFSNTIFKNAFISEGFSGLNNFTNANFKNATLLDFRTNQDNFTNASFKNAVFVGSNTFDASNFTNANFANVVFGAEPRFSGDNFTKANFSGVDLTHVTWNSDICPDGSDTNDNGDTCLGHLNSH